MQPVALSFYEGVTESAVVVSIILSDQMNRHVRIIMQPFTLRVIESAFGVVVGHRKDPCIAYCMKKPQGVTHWHMDYMSHW